MDIADALREIGMAMGGSQVNRFTGCLEFCDGTPDALTQEQKSILLASADLIVEIEPDRAQIDALVERVQKFGAALSQIENVCAAKCSGAFDLFDRAEEMFDDNDNPVKRPCPMRDRLANIPLDIGNPAI